MVVTVLSDLSKPLEELRSRDTRSCVHGQFQVTNFFVYLFHEAYDEVHQLVLVHLLYMVVGYQETNIVSL